MGGLEGAMKSLWGQYLLAGVVTATVAIVLPVGIGRDALCCLIASSGAAAMVVGTRRNRPAAPIAWYLIAAGMATWVVASALDARLVVVGRADAAASPSDAFYLITYPLVSAGLLFFAQSRDPERRPPALLESAILTVGAGLLSWVFLIDPAVSAARGSILGTFVTIAYPLCSVLLFGALVRLAKVPAAGWTPGRAIAGVFGTLLALQIVAKAAPWVSVIDVRPALLDPTWLLATGSDLPIGLPRIEGARETSHS